MSESIGWKAKALRVTRSALCVMLCCVMVFAYSYKKPVKVHATGIAEGVLFGLEVGATAVGASPVVGGALVAVAVGALGIGVGAMVSGDSYQEECQEIYKGLSRNAAAGLIVAGTLAKPILQINSVAATEIRAAVMGSIALSKSISDAKKDIAKFSLSGTHTLPEIASALGISGMGFSHITGSPADMSNLTNFKVLRAVPAVGAGILTYELADKTCIAFKTDTDNKYHCENTYFGHYPSLTAALYYNDSAATTSWMVRGGITTYTDSEGKIETHDNGKNYIVAFMSGTTQFVANLNIYKGSIDGKTYGDILAVNGSQGEVVLKGLGEDVVNVADRAWYAKELSTLHTDLDSYLARILALQEKTANQSISAYPPMAQSATQANADWLNALRSKTLADLLDATIAATAAEKALTDAWNSDKDITVPPPLLPTEPTKPAKPDGLPDLSLPDLLSKKFPFCIPFDIYAIVSGFYCAEAKAPHWEIPVVNKRYGWNWKIVLDWSQFEPVAVVCRWFTGAAWVFALILVTRKLIGAGGGD